MVLESHLSQPLSLEAELQTLGLTITHIPVINLMFPWTYSFDAGQIFEIQRIY